MTTTAIRVAGHAPLARGAAWSLVVVGAAAAVAFAAIGVRSGDLGLLLAGVLPVAWLVAGAVSLRVRGAVASSVLLTSVGALHLTAFASSGTLVTQTSPAGPAGWTVALVSAVMFSGGFAALGTLLANYPAGTRPSRAFAPAAFAVAVIAPLLEGLTHAQLPLVVSGDVTAVTAPAGLPLVELPVSFYPASPLLVVAGAVMLVRRSRRADAALRRQLSWATGAGGVLTLLLLATPGTTVLLPDALWSFGFVVVVSTIPFILLAGLVGDRSVDVDRFVGQALAHGAVLVSAVSAFALLVVSGADPRVGGVLTLVATVLVGGPLARRLAGTLDRRLTGGRVHAGAVVRRLVESLESTAPEQVLRRTADTIRDGLGVSWVRVVLDTGTGADEVAVAGSRPTRGPEPATVVHLAVAGVALGRIECGPRRGGWGEAELSHVRLLARHAGLALHTGMLTAQLAEQVEQLRASRSRLVHAEQSVRRRLERDLHDGVQQQLVALLSRLGALEVLMPPASPGAAFVSLAKHQAELSLSELRELIRGIHPPVLVDRGLVAAIRSRTALLPLPADLVVEDTLDRLTPETETAAYYVVSEALTNVLKHADAGSVTVRLGLEGQMLRVSVHDDGVGLPARTVEPPSTSQGTGLGGLRDRVEALGGRLTTASPPGGGTTVTALLPVEVNHDRS